MNLAATPFATAAPSHPLHLTDRVAPDPEVAWRALEDIDYGLILVDPDGQFQHANHLARQELASGRFLCIDRGTVTSPSPLQGDEVARGIRLAARGRRQMLSLRNAAERMPVACVPVFQSQAGESAPVLLMLAPRACTQALEASPFAREHRLTQTEEAALRSLCDGLEVQDIASSHGVRESGFRTQTRSLRGRVAVRAG